MIPVFVVATLSAKHFPAWYEKTVAGYAFTFDEKHGQAGVIDPKSEFMLVRTAECDGAAVTLVLTRDRKEVAGLGFYIHGYNFTDKPEGEDDSRTIMSKKLPSLSTSHGITIGATPATLLKKLGKPSQKEVTGSRNQFTNYTYHCTIHYTYPSGGFDMDYDQTYVFKAGHLIEISFASGPADRDADAPAQKSAKKTKSDPRRD